MSLSIAVVNGPNLNRLGVREPHIYGSKSWDAIWEELQAFARPPGIDLHYFQSNSEGALIDHLQSLSEKADGIVFNPGAYAHTSIALMDCVASLSMPVVEVHLSRLRKRDPFRHHSFVAEAACASIVGFGPDGYRMGLTLLISNDATQ